MTEKNRYTLRSFKFGYSVQDQELGGLNVTSKIAKKASINWKSGAVFTSSRSEAEYLVDFANNHLP